MPVRGELDRVRQPLRQIIHEGVGGARAAIRPFMTGSSWSRCRGRSRSKRCLPLPELPSPFERSSPSRSRTTRFHRTGPATPLHCGHPSDAIFPIACLFSLSCPAATQWRFLISARGTRNSGRPQRWERQMSDLEQTPFGATDFTINPEQRCACLLLLDTSASMDGAPIAN